MKCNTLLRFFYFTNSQQPTANSQQPTANSQQPTANSQQPTANSQQPTANNMPLIELKTIIKADLQTCFDLSRDIDFHTRSLEHSKEKAVEGKTSGLIGLNEWVTWEAFHFGIKQRLTSKITVFESPNYFVDEMVSGAFKSFKHEHIFTSEGNTTLMIDKFHFESPFGILGVLANRVFLKRYMSKLLKQRNGHLKQEAESKIKTLI